jgi:tRNA modification GTPase
VYRRDTIAAIATAAGPGGIGIIRVSGPDAEPLAAAAFRRTAGGTWDSHRLYRGRVVDSAGRALDDGLAVIMRAPHSYTGETVLELHCHGSPVVLRSVLAALLAAGARAAEPGEFTERAFLNGKLDLTQAEAVAALIRARTTGAAAAAADQLFGRLSAHLETLRERLVRAKAHLEVRIDFSEEEVAVDEAGFIAALDALRVDVQALLATYGRGRVLRDGLRVVLVGAPNAGKSSLLNALLAADRAIVTPEPGTTRDVIEAAADFAGVPVVLADTAGIRPATDDAERIGVERAHAVAAAADVVLLVLDWTRALEEQPSPARPAIAVINKIDLPCIWSADALATLERERTTVRVSATLPCGLDALRSAVIAHAAGAHSDQLPVLTSARQEAALRHVEAGLARATDAARAGMPADLIAVDVQAALDHLGAVTGAVSSEEVLDAVFREFCIGK